MLLLAAGVRLRAAVCNFPEHETTMRLLTALDSGVGEELKAAVEYNTSFFFSDPQSHSAELPETLWAMHTPYGFCCCS